MTKKVKTYLDKLRREKPKSRAQHVPGASVAGANMTARITVVEWRSGRVAEWRNG